MHFVKDRLPYRFHAGDAEMQGTQRINTAPSASLQSLRENFFLILSHQNPISRKIIALNTI